MEQAVGAAASTAAQYSQGNGAGIVCMAMCAPFIPIMFISDLAKAGRKKEAVMYSLLYAISLGAGIYASYKVSPPVFNGVVGDWKKNPDNILPAGLLTGLVDAVVTTAAVSIGYGVSKGLSYLGRRFFSPAPTTAASVSLDEPLISTSETKVQAARGPQNV